MEMYKGKLHNTHSSTQGNHDNDILHCTIENSSNSILNLNNDIDSNHGESHWTSFDENKNKNKSDNDFTCYCGKKCKGLRGLRAHQRSCVASNLDDLKALFIQSNATNQLRRRRTTVTSARENSSKKKE